MTTDGVADSRQGIQSVELAMKVLTALETGLGPMSLTQIATASGMQPSKAHRYLVSLGRIGMVSQSPASGRYDLGPALRRLGVEALRRMDEVGVASAHLPALRDRTQHSVNLAVWGDSGPVIVRWDYGGHALPITVRVGATLPLLSSSVGLVYLAHLPPSMTDPVLTAQQAAADQDRPSARQLHSLRARVLRDGYARTSGAVIPGVTSLAAPIYPAGESLPLVASVAVPARSATDEEVASVVVALRDATSTIAAELGNPDNTAADQPA